MNDLPPQHEKIVIVTEYKKYNEAIIKRSLWQEIEHQMEITGDNLDQLISKALESYVKDLKDEQEKEKFHRDFSEYQLFHSNPIPIRPHPGWYYNLEDDKK